MSNTPSHVAHIALLGCGLMGQPMARRLLQAGHTLTVWNRTRSKAEALVGDGAQVAATPASAVAGADVVITMLDNGEVVRQVLFESSGHGGSAADAMRPGCLFIDMGSILPAQAQAHARDLAPRGLRVLDAPVSGGTLGAQAGTLAIMVGGAAADFDAAVPVLSALGRPVHVGPAGSGQLAKLANQMIVGITIGAVAEALLLVERGGADPAKVREALRGGFAESRILEVHGQRMVEGDFAKRGSLAIQLKDLRNALHTAGEMAFDAPITEALRGLYADAADHGMGDLDQSGLFCELRRRQAG
ncbi:2-hydroxy-3-oxopropionate reductase [Aquabacterium commune]|uniref:2-hydroxy-3-oxopropionate reductase n=1 Tax=Aquabacterium commune TaxID=70586 RepID=A0A4V3CWY7_9BURK|nr:NAD(P)-dependent oxidoreductase [Aquabacterium commune]TDP88188.1 2-hydroxy-3-oxopropionate reductase [Aquabacterium commune]